MSYSNDLRRGRRMETIDKLHPVIRGLVHQYGWNVVKALLDVGIRKPEHIRHIVETVLDEFSPTRGTSSHQGIRPAPRECEPLSDTHRPEEK